MRPLPRAARLVAGSATVTLVAALAWLPVGAASASVQNNFFALADGNSSYTGAGVFDCTLTAGVDNPQSLPATFSSGTPFGTKAIPPAPTRVSLPSWLTMISPSTM